MTASSKSIFHIAGDAPAPPIRRRGDGIAADRDMSDAPLLGQPNVLYRVPMSDDVAVILEVDAYEDLARPGELAFLHLLCPKCQANGRTNALKIAVGNKRISYDPKGKRKPFDGWTKGQMAKLPNGGLGGLLSVEAFRCTWEAEPAQRHAHGLSVCSWHVVIDCNVAHDVR